MAGDKAVHAVEHAVGDDSQKQAERLRESQREQELASAHAVADRRAACAYEVPARVALALGDICQQRRRLLVPQRQEVELLVPVELGDDPRRPAAQSSVGVVEKDGALALGHSASHPRYEAAPRLKRPRAITSRWISLVPSQMRSTRSSR